jgi:hypothetical protein
VEDKTPAVVGAVEEEILEQVGSAAAEAAVETQRCPTLHRMP